jgi:hypothetical protein
MPLQELLTLVRSPAADSALDPSRRSNADQPSRIVAAQAATVAQYLVEHEGSAVMRRLAQGYLAGRSLADMLAEMSATARGVPQLEQNWKVWVRTNGE